MPTFAEVRQGTRARKPATLVLSTGQEVVVDLRVLTPLETIGVLAAAAAFARGRDMPADDGSQVYDLAVQVHTLVVACLDHDSPADAPKPFFDSVDQVLASQVLPPDGIAHLFAVYEAHADSMALSPEQLTEAGMRQLIEATAEGDMLPFCKLRPGMQWSFVRFMALAQRTALRAKLPSTSGSANGTPEPSAPAPTNGASNGGP